MRMKIAIVPIRLCVQQILDCLGCLIGFVRVIGNAVQLHFIELLCISEKENVQKTSQVSSDNSRTRTNERDSSTYGKTFLRRLNMVLESVMLLFKIPDKQVVV